MCPLSFDTSGFQTSESGVGVLFANNQTRSVMSK
jgi:hypothetical protein